MQTRVGQKEPPFLIFRDRSDSGATVVTSVPLPELYKMQRAARQIMYGVVSRDPEAQQAFAGVVRQANEGPIEGRGRANVAMFLLSEAYAELQEAQKQQAHPNPGNVPQAAVGASPQPGQPGMSERAQRAAQAGHAGRMGGNVGPPMPMGGPGGKANNPASWKRNGDVGGLGAKRAAEKAAARAAANPAAGAMDPSTWTRASRPARPAAAPAAPAASPPANTGGDGGAS